MTVVFEREPLEDEREALIDALVEARAQFDRRLSMDLVCRVDRRPMDHLIGANRAESGYLVYARNEPNVDCNRDLN